MKVRVDLRDVRVDDLSKTTNGLPVNVGLLVTSWQWSAWHSTGSVLPESSRILVMVPDFLYYARLASTGQAREIINLPKSLIRLTKTALTCVPTGMRSLPGLARGNFWAAAEALLTYDLGLLERSFRGEVILHYNLTDFMWLFNRESFLDRFANKAKGMTWGIATQQLEVGLSACARWNRSPGRIMYTTSLDRKEMIILEIARGRSFPKTRWTVDLTQWPADIVDKLAGQSLENRLDDEWLLTSETALILQSNRLLIP